MKDYSIKANYKMRAAWTLIEFIFIVIIIGILAATAIPKLAATRDDAKLAVDISNMSQCIQDVSSKFVASGVNMAAGDSAACDAVRCYDITYASEDSDFIVTTNPGAENYCERIDEVGSHLAKTYVFTGTSINY